MAMQRLLRRHTLCLSKVQNRSNTAHGVALSKLRPMQSIFSDASLVTGCPIGGLTQLLTIVLLKYLGTCLDAQ